MQVLSHAAKTLINFKRKSAFIIGKLVVDILTCALFQHRRCLTGTAVVAENIGRQLIVAGTRLSLHPVFNT